MENDSTENDPQEALEEKSTKEAEKPPEEMEGDMILNSIPSNRVIYRNKRHSCVLQNF
jgi:hypothetical protein